MLGSVQRDQRLRARCVAQIGNGNLLEEFLPRVWEVAEAIQGSATGVLSQRQHFDVLVLVLVREPGTARTSRSIVLDVRSAATRKNTIPATPREVRRISFGYECASARTTAPRFVATKGGGKTEIWRAVEPDELADLIGSGKYRPGPGNEGKYFFPTKAQAKNLADNILPGTKFCITSGCIDSSVLAKIDKIYPAGEGQAWFIPNELPPYIDDIVIHGPA